MAALRRARRRREFASRSVIDADARSQPAGGANRAAPDRRDSAARSRSRQRATGPRLRRLARRPATGLPTSGQPCAADQRRRAPRSTGSACSGVNHAFMSSSAFLPAASASQNRIDVVDASAPCAAARILQRGPQARVVRQLGIGREVGARRPLAPGFASPASTPIATPSSPTRLTDAFERVAIDDDLNEIAVAQLADRPARQRFRRHVADARARRDAAEPRVGEHRDVLAERADT